MSASNPRVMFIHGLIGFLHPEVPTGWQVLAPDMPGYGALADVDSGQISLPGQVEYLRGEMDAVSAGTERWHLVGHSVGGAIAALFAAAYPQRVASVISVEGNFTLDDAFWSQQLARMPLADVEKRLSDDRTKPEKWLQGAGVAVTPQTLQVANECLAFQPASTLQRVAASVVEQTGAPAYLQAIRGWIEQIPLHLIAGERSASGWHVPAWARERAVSYRELPGCGHLMMLEDPQGFVAAIRDLIGSGPA